MPEATLPLYRGGRIKVGRTLDPKALRFPGRMYARQGFGLDLSANAERALLSMLLQRPQQKEGWLDADWLTRHKVLQSYTDALDAHTKDRPKLKEATTHLEMTARLNALTGEYLYKGMSLAQVAHAPDNPEDIHIADLPIILSWRHHQFASQIIGQMLPHLRTSEMVHPQHVWERVLELFSKHCTGLLRQYFAVLPLKKQQTESLALAYATYEQLLRLRRAAVDATEDYRLAISERVIEHDEQTMSYDGISDLASARRIRAQAYQELLDELMDIVVRIVRRHVKPKRS